MKLRLIDCDGDHMECSGKNKWSSWEDCKKDIIRALSSGNLSTGYLPWKFTATELNDDEDIVCIQVNKFYVSLDTDTLASIPHEDQNE
jgi:hypothetical protein